MAPKTVAPHRTAAGISAARQRWDGPETDARKIRKILRKTRNHSVSVRDILKVLQVEDPLTVWDLQRVRGAVKWSQNKQKRPGKSKNPINIRLAKGGKSVYLVTSGGTHPRGTGHVGEALKAFNGAKMPRPGKKMFGIHAEMARAFDTHASVRLGKWSSPDLIVCFYSRTGSRKPREVHSFELQEPTKKPLSHNLLLEIAQSFVCSTGYQRCWFMVHRKTWSTFCNHENGVQIDRARQLATRLGVGIIIYGDARKMSTWSRIQKARPLGYSVAPSKHLKRLQLAA